jgi:hypothetical protein
MTDVVNTARPAGISYTDGDRQRVYRAFSDALDRLAVKSQPLNGWEGGQMLRALAALATGAYSIAEGSIHAALTRTPRGLDSPSQDEPVTVEGLRVGFLATVEDTRHSQL